jgi:hypothetical protein
MSYPIVYRTRSNSSRYQWLSARMKTALNPPSLEKRLKKRWGRWVNFLIGPLRQRLFVHASSHRWIRTETHRLLARCLPRRTGTSEVRILELESHLNSQLAINLSLIIRYLSWSKLPPTTARQDSRTHPTQLLTKLQDGRHADPGLAGL